MYFKCAECGHIFEEGEVYEVYEDPSGGDYPVCVEQSCPKCRGAYEEAVRCADCGGLFLKDELLAGLCKDCFKEAINYSTFLVFADYEPDEPDETNILQSFIAEVVPALSDSSRRNCRKLYLSKAVTDIAENNGNAFLKQIRDYVDDHYVLEFAEFLETQKGVRE